MAGTSFVAIYRGSTIAGARLVAVSADPGLVADVCARLLESPAPNEPDTVAASIEHGRRAALRLIREEADGVSSA